MCDLALRDHVAGRLCEDRAHQAALARRAAGAPEWGGLTRTNYMEADGDGVMQVVDFRDHLEDVPISCGTGLLLQGREWRSDDFGEYLVLLPTGAPVHYEINWGAQGKRAVVCADVVGHEFEKAIESWMRFRWPPGRK
jgi:hypothetical protein